MAKRKRKKKYHRRGGFRLACQVISVILALVAVLIGSVLFFQVEQIEVSGNQKFSTEQVLATASVSPKANLILLPTGQIKRRLEIGFPYFKQVKIHRVFPSTLKIQITEYTPIAAIKSEDLWWLLAEDGKVLEQVDATFAQEHIQVFGLKLRDPQVGATMQAAQGDEIRQESLGQILAALFEKGMMDDVSWIDLSGTAEIELEYQGKFLVKLPMSADFSRRFRILEEIVAGLEPDASGTVDLRSDRVFYRLK